MIEFVATIIINSSPDEVFRYVANRENYPQWISAVSGAHVAILSQGHSGRNAHPKGTRGDESVSCASQPRL